MPHNPHDQFAKQFLGELLEPFGRVELSREILGEPRWIDLWFQPDRPSPGSDRPPIDLGLLGTLTQSPCLLEPYRNPPDFDDLRSCLAKQYAVVADHKRQHPTTPEDHLPHLWILVPTCSDAARRHCGALPDPALPQGCYGLAPLLGTHLIVIHQLPPTPETLWLRLLGKGRCQREAIAEVLDLPQPNTHRDLALQLLVNWKIALDAISPPPSEEEDTFMALSRAYQEWEQKTIRLGEQRGIQIGEQRGIQIGEQRGIQIGEQRGIQIGEQQGQRRMLLELLALELEFKFGAAGLELARYLAEIEAMTVLAQLMRSLKPMTEWDQVRDWWLDQWPQWAQELEADRRGPYIGVALKLRFPEGSVEAIAQAQAAILTGTASVQTLANLPEL